jgi:AAA domain, putative AbiEii toxin, Type IV TA system
VPLRSSVKLIGCSTIDKGGPIHVAYIPLDDVTVVLGANDVGKSRLLRELAFGLGRDSEPSSRSRTAYYFDLGAPWGQQVDRSRPARSPESSSRSIVEDALRRSQIGVAIRTDNGGWSLHLCLPPRSDLGPEVLEALGQAFPAITTPWEISGEMVKKLPITLTPDSPTRHPQAPVPLYELGSGPGAPLPKPTMLPADFETTAADLAGTVTSFLHRIEWLRSVVDYSLWSIDNLADGPPDESVLSRAADLWYPQRTDGGTFLHSAVLEACALIEDAANEFLPPFISSEYRLLVEPTPLQRWASDDKLTLRLAFQTGDAVPFGVADAAEGYRLWIQLSVLEGADRLAEIIDKLDLMVTYAREHIKQHREAENALQDALDAPPDDDADDLLGESPDVAFERQSEAELRESLEAFAGACSDIIDRLPGPSGGETGSLAALEADLDRLPSLAAPPSFQYRGRLYLVDEPERHLHPRLQRAAARWLAHRMAERRSQCIISSHSAAFLNLARDTSFVFSRREEHGSSVHPIDAIHITALSEVAAALGLNRGELLTNISIVLFVEGMADRQVIESIFRRELHDLGVMVVPLHSVGRHGQIVDSDVLTRVTTAHPVACFDRLGADELHRLMMDDAYQRESLRSRKTELQNMASLLQRIRQAGRTLTPLGIPEDDIFFVLDENVLKEKFSGFPGHEEAQREWKASKSKEKWKSYYDRTYGIDPGVETYVEVAEEMARRGIVPESLQDILFELERLALNQS